MIKTTWLITMEKARPARNALQGEAGGVKLFGKKKEVQGIFIHRFRRLHGLA